MGFPFKTDQKARNQWVSSHARQIGQFKNVSSPSHNTCDKEMEKETKREDTGNMHPNTRLADPLHSGSEAHASTVGTTQGEAEAGETSPWQTPLTTPTHLRFGTPAPPPQPLSGLVEAHRQTKYAQQNPRIDTRPSGSRAANQATNTVKP